MHYFPGATYNIGMAVGIIIALLLMVIIILMVIGFVRKHRRKNSQWRIPNSATLPNPMYGNNQSKLCDVIATLSLNQQNYL